MQSASSNKLPASKVYLRLNGQPSFGGQGGGSLRVKPMAAVTANALRAPEPDVDADRTPTNDSFNVDAFINENQQTVMPNRKFLTRRLQNGNHPTTQFHAKFVNSIELRVLFTVTTQFNLLTGVIPVDFISFSFLFLLRNILLWLEDFNIPLLLIPYSWCQLFFCDYFNLTQSIFWIYLQFLLCNLNILVVSCTLIFKIDALVFFGLISTFA